jgi:hypothetical protein
VFLSVFFFLIFAGTKNQFMKSKILLFSVVLTVVSFSSFSQFSKGDMVLGLGLNFQSSVNELNSGFIPQTNKATSYGISTELGFANKENRLNGFFVNGSFGVSRQEFTTQPTTNSRSDFFNVGMGYFTRRYKSLGKNFFLFGEGRATLNYGNEDSPSFNTVKLKSYGVYAGFSPGLSYKVNSRFLLELKFADFVNMGYTYQELTAANGVKDFHRSFSFNSSLGLGYLRDIGIGVRWIIPSKRK